MKDNYRLTEGNIFRQLLLISIPVMGTSFVQMAYNLTDIFWLGRLSEGAVASAGFAGYFTWFGASVILLARIGTEVRVAQRVGNYQYDEAKDYARTGVQLVFIFGLIYALAMFFFAEFWISFFSIGDAIVTRDAVDYLRIVSIGLVFYMLNPVYSASLNGTGNTLLPFLISATGLVINMILDPIMIFTFGWGLKGAAYATVIAQITVSVTFWLYFRFRDSILTKARYLKSFSMNQAKDILRLGVPAAMQTAIFAFIAMIIARFVVEAGEGSSANAVQKIGSQIESLSWLVAGGFSTALGAFVGQNYGAKQFSRVFKGIRYAMVSMIIYGLFVGAFLFFGAEQLFTIFVPEEPNTIRIGIEYLQILAISQVFMIIEAVIGGAFNGLGKTVPQSVVGIVFNASRIGLARLFMVFFGLNGIWMAISLSSVLKGIVLWVWFKIYVKRKGLDREEDLPISELLAIES